MCLFLERTEYRRNIQLKGFSVCTSEEERVREQESTDGCSNERGRVMMMMAHKTLPKGRMGYNKRLVFPSYFGSGVLVA